MSHRSSLSRYVLSWLGLLLLTGLTVALASAPLGSYGVAVALLIAGTKATIVVLVFMHFLDHPPAVRLVLGMSLLFVALIGIFVQADYATRFRLTLPADPGLAGGNAAHRAGLDDPDDPLSIGDAGLEEGASGHHP